MFMLYDAYNHLMIYGKQAYLYFYTLYKQVWNILTHCVSTSRHFYTELKLTKTVYEFKMFLNFRTYRKFLNW